MLVAVLVLLGCEDKKKKVDPLIGTWKLTESSSGTYVLVNRSQLAYFPWLPAKGDLRLSEFDGGAFLDSVTMKHFSVYRNEDVVRISIEYRSQELEYRYEIQDYRPVLNQFDRSSLEKWVRNEFYPYTGDHFEYTLTNNDRSLQLSQDTLYRQVSINYDDFIDSTRMIVLSGSLSQEGEQIVAGEPYHIQDRFAFMGMDGFPEGAMEMTLVLNQDGTGTITTKDPYGGYGTRNIEWVATDSTLSLIDCFELDCYTNQYNYTLVKNHLTLEQRFSFCGDYPDCYRDQERFLGLESNTLEDYWSESVQVFNRN